MAVTFQNPAIITSVMSTSYKAQALAAGYGSFRALRIEKVYWENPGTIGDTATIQDGNGATWLTLRCEVANQSQIVNFNNTLWSDFIVTALSSGTLYIYLR